MVEKKCFLFEEVSCIFNEKENIPEIFQVFSTSTEAFVSMKWTVSIFSQIQVYFIFSDVE